MKEYRILAPTAILGYGFPLDSFRRGMDKKPDVIAVDAGSTDPGPYYLGAGVSFTDESAVKRDLKIMLIAALENEIPLIIGSAGGSGGEPHLQWNIDIINEIARENGLSFKIAIIRSEISKGVVAEYLDKGKIYPLPPAPELNKEELWQTVRIVGQMGIEPFIEALECGAQVVVAGRAYDPAIFAAPAILKGYDKGLALHLGKILECACLAATPGSGSDCMLGILGDGYFTVEPLNPNRKATTSSVAAHTLYEKSNPYVLPGPGGVLDLKGCEFKQINDRTVLVNGSKFEPAKINTVKLEGVKKIGYRTVSIAGTRDPIMISKIDDIIESVRDIIKDNFRDEQINYHLDFKIYGKNAVMGKLETSQTPDVHELGILIDVVAGDQETANTICSFTRSTMLHYGYEGRISTAGNLAFPYSPSEFKAGAVYVFSVYHLMDVFGVSDIFPVEIRMVKGR